MSSERPVGAAWWPRDLAVPPRGRLETPERAWGLRLCVYRGGVARATLYRAVGRDHAYPPDLVGVFQLHRVGDRQLAWAMAQAATARYLDLDREDG